MPIFEYRCNDCSTKFEILHLSKEKFEDIICPKCHSNNYTKLLSHIAKPISEGSDSFDDVGSTNSDYDFGGSCGCGAGSCGCN